MDDSGALRKGRGQARRAGLGHEPTDAADARGSGGAAARLARGCKAIFMQTDLLYIIPNEKERPLQESDHTAHG